MELEAQKPVGFSKLTGERYDQFTKSEKRIANFLNQNQDEAAFLSAGEIAKRLELSEATIVRFARTLGFDSYPTMRVAMQDDFRHRLTHASRLRSRLDDFRESGDIFERLVASEMDYMTEALQTIDRKAFNAAVKLLRTHQRIFVFGLGPSISLVNLMELRLRRFGKEVTPLTSSGREVLEPLVTLEPGDIMFVICFFDQNPALKLVLEHCRKVGCKIIMLTDTLDAILGDKVDVMLAARRGPVGEFHSLVVPMTVINAILISLASIDQEKILPILDKLDTLRDQLNRFNSGSG